MTMKRRLASAAVTAWICSVPAQYGQTIALAQDAAPATNPDSFYRLGPDSLEQEGVPKGEVRGPFTLPSAAYPGTEHTYWVYVPAQYTSSEPARHSRIPPATSGRTTCSTT